MKVGWWLQHSLLSASSTALVDVNSPALGPSEEVHASWGQRGLLVFLGSVIGDLQGGWFPYLAHSRSCQ
jgi:hypothetical protein